MTEEQEFEELALLEEFEAQDKLNDVDTGPVEAFARGAAEIVTMDFADEIEAGLDTASDYLSGEFNSIEDLSNTYNKNLDAARDEYAAGKMQHPDAYLAGQVTGGVGSAFIPGGAVIKGANATAKAISAAKISALYGGVAGLGQTEEDKLSLKGALATAEGAVLGAVGGSVVHGVSKVAAPILSKVGQKLGISPENLIKKAYTGIGLKTQGAKTKFNDKLVRKGKDPVKWINNIAKETDINGKPLIGNVMEGYESIAIKTKNKIKKYALERDDILSQVKKPIDRQGLATSIKANLLKDKSIKAGDAKAINDLINEQILMKPGMIKTKQHGEQLGMVVNEDPLSALDFSQLRKDLGNQINFDSFSKSTGAIKKALYKAFNDKGDDIVFRELGEELAKKNKGLRGKMSDLIDLEDSLKIGQNYEKFGETAYIKDTFALYRDKAAADFIIPGSGKYIAGTMLALRKMSMSPRLGRRKAFNADRLADALPNMSESSLRRLVVTSDHEDFSVFNSAMAAGIAESDFKQDPLPRQADRAIERQESIMALVNEHAPQYASQIQKAFETGDKAIIGNIMCELADLPKAQGLIEEGIGFDGIAYKQQDKDICLRQLNASGIPGSQRVKMALDLKKNGIIPDFNKVVQPEQKIHIPRKNKKQHDY